MKPEIFVSHAPEDQAIADDLCAGLEARGFACWSASRLVPTGVVREQTILFKIESCCVMLVLLSARSDLSPLIEREVAHAIRHRVAILPLRLSEFPEPSNFEVFFERYQWLDLFPPPIEPHIEQLSNAIQRLVEPQHGRVTTVCPAPDEPTPPHGFNWRGDHPRLGGSKESAVLASPPISDRVTFAAFAPATIAPLQSFILDVWAHTAAQSKAVAEQASELRRGSKVGVKREVSVTRDTILGVVLEIPTLRIPDPTDSLVWRGEPSNASFIVEVPPDAAHGTHPGRAIITASGIPVTKLIFSLLVSAQAPSTDAAPILNVTSAGPVDLAECGPGTAFASYSSRDRAEVLARVQGMHKIRPELDVFVDVISLRAGQHWEEQIGRHVRSDDVFFLFWSEHAAASKEVEKEWRLALEVRGIDYIDPVPLSDPAEVKPPRELQELHFNDYYLAHIKLSQQRRANERKSWWKFWPPPRPNWRGDHPRLSGAKESAVPLISDRVTFAAFAPTTIVPLQSFVLDVWAHTAAQSKAVAEQASELRRGSKLGVKREVSVTRGTVLGVVLEIPTLRIPDPVDSLVWHGEPSNASFIVEVPLEAAHGTHPGRAIITASGIPVTKLIFSLLVSAQAPSTDAAPIPATERMPRTAFASYSSSDRAEVLARVQGMHKIRPELDVFVDVISLRAGQHWEEQIGRHVRSDDIFFLFWSKCAAASKEVEKEWRLALEARGIDYIDPVPLIDPAEVIPPRELQALHFNDYYLAHIKLNRQRRKGASERKSWWKFW